MKKSLIQASIITVLFLSPTLSFSSQADDEFNVDTNEFSNVELEASASITNPAQSTSTTILNQVVTGTYCAAEKGLQGAIWLIQKSIEQMKTNNQNGQTNNNSSVNSDDVMKKMEICEHIENFFTAHKSGDLERWVQDNDADTKALKCLNKALAACFESAHKLSIQSAEQKEMAQMSAIQDNIKTILTSAETISTETSIEFVPTKSLVLNWKKYQADILHQKKEYTILSEKFLKKKLEESKQESERKCATTKKNAELLCTKEIKAAEDLYKKLINKKREETLSMVQILNKFNTMTQEPSNNINEEDLQDIDKFLAIYLKVEQDNQSNASKTS